MDTARRYRVHVRVTGELGPALAARFADLTVRRPGDGTTELDGELVDEPAVHGLLARIRDLGLSIVEVDGVAITAGDGDGTSH